MTRSPTPPHGPLWRAFTAVASLVLAFTLMPGSLRGPALASTSPPDHITVEVGGSPAYRLGGDVAAGGVAITDDPAGYSTSAITGRATVSGTAGRKAVVTFHIASGLGLSGTFTLRDRTAGLKVSAYILGGISRTSDSTVTWHGSASVRRGSRSSSQPVSFRVQDRRLDPGVHAVTLTHAGQQRHADVYVPAGYAGKPTPALVHFPGLLETPAEADYFGHMSTHAGSHGYLLIIPEHYGSGWQGVPGGPATPDVDDPGFVRALMATAVQRFNADPSRLYASGMSNGSFFTQTMACRESDLFAAFAAVSGPLADAAGCHPGGPVPIVMMHGDADPIVPYTGAPTIGVPATAAFWSSNNGCQTTTADTPLPDTDPQDNTTVVRHTYQGCPATAPVILYQIRGGGHNWPGGTPYVGPLLGNTTHDIDANTVIWDFVSAFRLSH